MLDSKEKVYSLDGKWTEELHSTVTNPALAKRSISNRNSSMVKSISKQQESDGRSSISAPSGTAISSETEDETNSNISSAPDDTPESTPADQESIQLWKVTPRPACSENVII